MAAVELEEEKNFKTHCMHQPVAAPGTQAGSPEVGNCQKTFFSREHIMMMYLERYLVV